MRDFVRLWKLPSGRAGTSPGGRLLPDDFTNRPAGDAIALRSGLGPLHTAPWRTGPARGYVVVIPSLRKGPFFCAQLRADSKCILF